MLILFLFYCLHHVASILCCADPSSQHSGEHIHYYFLFLIFFLFFSFLLCCVQLGPVVKAPISSYWTTREIPYIFIFNAMF